MSEKSNKDRRKNVSFKNNMRDTILLEWAMDKAECYGFSSYIKMLIEEDMKRSCEDDADKSR